MPHAGIDLNAANLNLHIKRDGHGVPLPLAQSAIRQKADGEISPVHRTGGQDLAQLSNIEGLDPVILSIKPASQTALFSRLVAH